VARFVDEPTSTVPGSAAVCPRAAVFDEVAGDDAFAGGADNYRRLAGEHRRGR
jgi:hypothetical protein